MNIVRRNLCEPSHQLGNSRGRGRPKDQTQHGTVNATPFRFSLLFFLILFAGQFHSAARAQNPPRQFALKAESPKFWRLLDRNAQLVKLAGAFGFTEGPVWDERGFLYVSDEEQNKIVKLFSDGRKEDLIALGDPDGNTYDVKVA